LTPTSRSFCDENICNGICEDGICQDRCLLDDDCLEGFTCQEFRDTRKCQKSSYKILKPSFLFILSLLIFNLG
jgi:hypothetical protein